jgi:ATP-dependent RNA helicase RhlE
MNRVMIFVKSKGSANRIFDYLKHVIKGEIRLIHSNKAQNARINSFNDFREGNVRLLISTDVMARGIDVSGVSHVINFDVPTVYEDYVHRIGRTGRAWNEGVAITFVTKSDEYHITKIEKKIRMTIPLFPLPENLNITETPFEENQSMEREIDEQKKKEDPNFQGAFHEKKDYKLKQKQKKAKKVPKFSGKSKSVVQKTVKSGQKTSKHNRNKDK